MAWSSLVMPSTRDPISRPVSSPITTSWFCSTRYIRTIGLWRRAVAFQSMPVVPSSGVCSLM